MGAIGFTACGAAAAAFRLASSRPSPSNETLVIAGVLGLIGAVCVAAAAWNLYVRWSKPD
jgi:lysozyme